MPRFPVIAARFGALLALALASPGQGALAQAVPPAGMISPRGSDVFGPGSMLGSPGDSILRPGTTVIPMGPAGQVALSLSARFGKAKVKPGTYELWFAPGPIEADAP